MTNELRLLPWTSPDGKPCYLSSDGAGYVSQLADAVEAMQLEVGQELLHHARAMLAARTIPPEEFRFLSARLAEALHDVLHVARIRGPQSPTCTTPAGPAPQSPETGRRPVPTGPRTGTSSPSPSAREGVDVG
ncbi:hypothetical protein [Streptomyces sp. KR80]|uniref:hypothetical protein n=1 Tax=Streptomyces sp. KR80 TaxID=3457426 RepID=UPI003FCF93C6